MYPLRMVGADRWQFGCARLAILPIGGVFTMGPQEAAYACKLIRQVRDL